MEIIVFEKETYYQMLAEMKRSIREALREAKSEEHPQVKDEELWVDRKGAEAVLKCKKDKLKQLCQENEQIITTRTGRKILYYKPSLHDYLAEKSQFK